MKELTKEQKIKFIFDAHFVLENQRKEKKIEQKTLCQIAVDFSKANKCNLDFLIQYIESLRPFILMYEKTIHKNHLINKPKMWFPKTTMGTACRQGVIRKAYRLLVSDDKND